MAQPKAKTAASPALPTTDTDTTAPQLIAPPIDEETQVQTLQAEYIGPAEIEIAAGNRSALDSNDAVTAGRLFLDGIRVEIGTGPAPAPSPLGAELMARGVHYIFVLAGARTLDELAERLQRAPPDLRRFEVVAPEDEKHTRKAAATLSRFKKSAADEASRRKRLDDLKVLGRGLQFEHNDPGEVKTAIHQFLHGATSRMELLAGAGMLPKDITLLEGLHNEMAEIQGRQNVRRAVKTDVIDRIYVLTAALEGFFKTARARVRLAAGEDELAAARLLSLLPRQDERRAARAEKTERPTPPSPPEGNG